MNYFRQPWAHAVQLTEGLDRRPMSRRLVREVLARNLDGIDDIHATVQLNAVATANGEMSSTFLGSIQFGPSAAATVAGALYFIEFVVSPEYPFRAPRVRLLTRCFHPGVTARGRDPCCLDITKDNWSPSLSLMRLLTVYAAALATPVFEDPLNAEVCALGKSDRARFDATATQWARWYAVARPHPTCWSVANHGDWPASQRRVVVCLLLMWRRRGTLMSRLPRDVLYMVVRAAVAVVTPPPYDKCDDDAVDVPIALWCPY